MNYRERIQCRLCGARVKTVFALSPTPIANNYSEKPDHGAAKYPLELTQCSVCDHIQQRYIFDALFEDYKYVTPATVARYLAPVAVLLKERYPRARKVLEIGSNNGTYLKVLREEGFDATGIDPAATGENNIEAYFTLNWAQRHNVRYDLILANNVFAHIDDLYNTFRGALELLAPGGAIVFEVQYLPALVKAGTFDMIYHEHMSYHTLAPLARFARRLGMVMTRYDHISTHGGSIRVTLERRAERVKEAWFTETTIDWTAFTERVNAVKERVRAMLEGREVVLLGAAAKVTTMIHHCGIADNILYACDDTPEKQGRYIPGTDIYIRPTSELRANAALLGAWNYAKEFREMFPNNELLNPYVELEEQCLTAGTKNSPSASSVEVTGEKFGHRLSLVPERHSGKSAET